MATTALRNTAPARRVKVYYGYIAALAVLAVASVALTFALTSTFVYDEIDDVPAAVWLMAALTVFVEFRPLLMRSPRSTAVAVISYSYVIALMVIGGYALALPVLTAATLLIGFRMKSLPARTAFNVVQWWLAASAAHLVLLAFDVSGMPIDSARDIGVVVLACVVWTAVSYLCVTTMMTIRAGGNWLVNLWQWIVGAVTLRVALIALTPILIAAATVSPWLVLLSAVPMYVVDRMVKQAAERERSSGNDPLTGLLNRKGFQEAVEEKILQCADAGASMAVLICDLDRFAEVNNTLGHAVGDRMLVELADRFLARKPPGKLVARIGGDEFAFALSAVDGLDDPHRCAADIREVLAEPVSLGEVSVDVTGAIGVACYPEHGTDFETLFRHADVAMYEAKQRAAPTAVYAPEFDHHSPERLSLLGDLRRALEDPQMPGLELHYQPQVAFGTGEVVGVEALLRYDHPTQGRVPTGMLIELAEHSAVMRTLTHAVIEAALRQLANWRYDGLDIRAAVNVSVRDLHASDFADFLAGKLAEHGVEPRQVQLEITESALMADPRRVMATVSKLEKMGIALSLDDFGTGFSSMQHLRRLPVSEVKIDRTFVTGITTDPDSGAIVRSIIELSGALGLRVVAEGVEDEATWQHLAKLGCHVAQGWFHARPMAADELAQWMRRYQTPGRTRRDRTKAASPLGPPIAAR